MRVTLYTRPGCQLCEEAKQALEALQAEFPHTLVEVDIEADERLLERYAEQIPVVQVGAYTLRAPIDRSDLRVTLAAARDAAPSPEPVTGAARERAIQANRGALFLARHWLAIFNAVVFIYVGLPFAAPVLMKLGATRPARWIYTAYSPMCHQWAFRSWFLFGEQAAYPRATAGTSLITYGQATGLDENDVLAARAFIGNERLGYKVAFCERDVAIYGGMLMAGLGFALVRRRLKPLHLALWVAFGVLPIALDGGIQLLSGLGLPGWPVYESTPLLRTVTGALFGVANVWLAYPYVEDSMSETRTLAAARLSGAGRVPSRTAGRAEAGDPRLDD
jgi:uncharacterized membrane protein/glutaredoxin